MARPTREETIAKGTIEKHLELEETISRLLPLAHKIYEDTLNDENADPKEKRIISDKVIALSRSFYDLRTDGSVLTLEEIRRIKSKNSKDVSKPPLYLKCIDGQKTGTSD